MSAWAHFGRMRRRAFTLLELVCTVAIIAILMALLLPVAARGYARAQRAACANSLRNVGVAFTSWAQEHGDLFPMQVSSSQGGTLEFAEATALRPDASFTYKHFQAISNELAVPKLLHCPADKGRARAEDFASLGNGNVSYWVNPAAKFARVDSPVAGDRNVRTSGRTEWTFIQFGPEAALEWTGEIHGHRGNVLFADAHVDDGDSRLLRAAFSGTNNIDVTLSLPRPAPGETGSASAAQAGAGGAGAGTSGGSAGMADAASGAEASAKAASNASMVATPAAPPNQTAAVSERSPRSRRPNGNAGAGEGTILVTRLDGTVVTSAPPRSPGHAPRDSAVVRSEMPERTDPIIEFIQALTRAAARNTYWLLLFLLAAMIAFELARRRAKRRRVPEVRFED